MIRESLRRVIALVKKEFIAIWKDPRSRGFIVGLPLLQLFVFANAITMEVTNIDVAVFDNSKSYESREVLSRFEHSPRFRKFYYIDTEKDFKHLIDTQRVQLGLYFDGDFSKNIKAQKQATVQVIADGRQTNCASIASSYASQIIAGYDAEINRHSGATIEPQIRNWYNPNLEYKWFLLTTLITLLSLIVTLLLTALSIAREREMGTFDQLIVSPLSPFEILLGKTIPPLILALWVTTLMSVLILIFFKLPFLGSVLLFFFAILISLLSVVGVGLFISSICNNQQQAILGVMTFQMPAVLLSGFMSPIEDMPQALQILTWLNPIRFYMKIVRGIFLKGMSADEVLINLIPLIIIATITLSAASWMFKRKLD